MKHRLAILGFALAALVSACTPTSRQDPLGSSSSTSGSGGSGSGGSTAPTATPVPSSSGVPGSPFYSSGGSSGTVVSGSSAVLGSGSGYFTPLTYSVGSSPAVGIVLPALLGYVLGTYNGNTLKADLPAGVSMSNSGISNTYPGGGIAAKVSGGLSTAQSATLNLTYCPYSSVFGSCNSSTYPTMSQLTGSTLQFDIMVLTPQSEVNNLWIYYGQAGCKAGFSIPLTTANLFTGFVHFSIPGNTFTMTGCAPSSPYVDTVFQVNLLKKLGTPSLAAFLIDDVHWGP